MGEVCQLKTNLAQNTRRPCPIICMTETMEDATLYDPEGNPVAKCALVTVIATENSGRRMIITQVVGPGRQVPGRQPSGPPQRRIQYAYCQFVNGIRETLGRDRDSSRKKQIRPKRQEGHQEALRRFLRQRKIQLMRMVMIILIK